MRKWSLHLNGVIWIGNYFEMFETDLRGHFLRGTRRKREAESGERREAERDREHTFHSVRRRGASANRLSAAAEHSKGTSSIRICRVHSSSSSAAAAASLTDFCSQRTGEFPVRCCRSFHKCRHFQGPQRLSVSLQRVSQRAAVSAEWFWGPILQKGKRLRDSMEINYELKFEFFLLIKISVRILHFYYLFLSLRVWKFYF